MQLETFRGRELPSVIRLVRATLGGDALILTTHALHSQEGRAFEVVAAQPEALERFRRSLDGGLAAARRAKTRRRVGPYTVALVGPSGAGKTTTAVKLALHPKGLGGRKIGFTTLDTYRVGALEELQTYAEITSVPMEVAYSEEDVGPAMQRFRDRDVIVVDTPGRLEVDGDWLSILRRIDPDEVHLVIPAGLRHDVALRLRDRFAVAGVTHTLFSKVDDLEDDAGLAQIAEAVSLPVRWIADGHEVPGALAAALPRILGALGRRSGDADSPRMAG
jgi:flagellar biosynthesis protein FlhF